MPLIYKKIKNNLFSLNGYFCCQKDDFSASTLSWTRKHEAHRYFGSIPGGSCKKY